MALEGRTLGRYRIAGKLGEGGMGIVYRAEDSTLGRDVAIKVLRPEPGRQAERVRRFSQEARAASALNHPNIVTVHDAGEFEDGPFLVMELVEGASLRALLDAGPLPLAKLLDIGLQAATALARAHQAGITHRDLKPENLLVRPDGYVKVLDFGLAKLKEKATPAEQDPLAATMESGLSVEGTILGTAAYMSPEQAMAQPVDARSDIFSLALVLLECWRGENPFRRGTMVDTLHAIVHDAPPPMKHAEGSVESGLALALEKALEKSPAARCQSMEEFAAGLRRLRQRCESQDETVAAPAPRFRVAGVGLRRWWKTALAAVLVIAFAAAGLYWRNRPVQGSESIAILPFVNGSGNPDMEYLADGITESLINSLSRLPNLSVMSRVSVFRFKGRETDVQEAGRKLNVQVVLTGRVVQRGDALSISAELIDVRNNRQVWGERYDRRLTDILAVQDEISTEIAGRLRLQLTSEEKQQIAKRYTQNTEAYQLYLKGRYHWNKKTPDGFNKGIELFRQAIQADPNYAPAYAGMAALYNNLANYNFALLPPREAWAQAKAAAERAITIDETLASAHTSLALVAYQWEWDWPKADREFRRALELDSGSASTYEPSPASTYHWYAHYLMSMGRTQESLRAGRRAVELEPLDLANLSHQGWHYVFIRQYDRAIEPLRKTIEMDPNWPVAPWYLGLAYEQQGAFEEAIAQFQNCVRITRGRPSMLALLGHAYAAANRRGEAQAILGQLNEAAKETYVPPYPLAVIHAALGNRDEAFLWLEKAYEARDSWLNYLGLDPRLDMLRSDPRFASLLGRLNLRALPSR